ncbi:MAG: YggS family pyridoxal phosphate-dependent enzyme [Eubacteriales bacterium]|nr:YggS family pyridoxal phosphate-dependent enzyme [Eubacteriales bacterium]
MYIEAENELLQRYHRLSQEVRQLSGRPSTVRLLAVSKTKPVQMIKELFDCGQAAFGENRVQELREKYRFFEEQGWTQPQWHLIGHLQRNKVKYIAPYIELIHSVDSLDLAAEISRQALLYHRVIPILIEVNVAQEDSKFGITVDEVESFVRALAVLPGICVKGLMTVAPFVDDPEENRWIFRKLHEIFIDIQQKNIDNTCICELSMGMSNDYAVAIEEGATIVRIGSSLFGSR